MALEDETGGAAIDSGVGIWRLAAGQPVPTWHEAAALSGFDDRTLPNLPAYWRMAIASATSDFQDINPAGWPTADGMRVGMNARVLTRRAPGRAVFVGAEAFVDKNVLLGDDVVIGDRACVAKGASLARTVVMPETYVGAGLVLDRAIACGSWLYRVETGALTRISDPTVLARLAA